MVQCHRHIAVLHLKEKLRITCRLLIPPGQFISEFAVQSVADIAVATDGCQSRVNGCVDHGNGIADETKANVRLFIALLLHARRQEGSVRGAQFEPSVAFEDCE